MTSLQTLYSDDFYMMGPHRDHGHACGDWHSDRLSPLEAPPWSSMDLAAPAVNDPGQAPCADSDFFVGMPATPEWLLRGPNGLA